MERVLRGVDSSLSVLYILTSANMPKRVYLEDVIDRVVLFTKYQLSNTIFPSFDPVYRVSSKKGKVIFLMWIFYCVGELQKLIK
jgi:cohesin loading factor subunit SCC2